MTRQTNLATPWAWAMVIALVLLTQANSYRIDAFGWDEFTFILVGQDVAEGRLPYVHLFDNKPPLIFALIGLVIAVFGKSLLAIRLAGDLLIVLSAMAGFALARKVVAAGPALAGALLVAACCAGAEGQPMMTEWPAAAFMGGACWLLCRSEQVSLRACALAGGLMALAVLSRSNLAIPTAALGLALLIVPRFCREFPFLGALAYAAGGMLIALLAAAPYLVAGHGDVLYPALILAPLAYSQQSGAAETILPMARELSRILAQHPLITLPVYVLVMLGCVRGVALYRAAAMPLARRTLALAALLSAATIASMVLGGAAYAHYWFQLLPFMGLAMALGLAELWRLPGRLAFIACLVALPIGAAIALHVASLAALARHPGQNAEHGDIRASARFITQRSGPETKVWAISHHLVLWYTGTPQLSSLGTHPSNLGRADMAAVLAEHGLAHPDELARIMAMRPEFIVNDTAGWGEKWLTEARPAASDWLARHYAPAGQFGQIIVLRRVAAPAPTRQSPAR